MLLTSALLYDLSYNVVVFVPAKLGVQLSVRSSVEDALVSVSVASVSFPERSWTLQSFDHVSVTDELMLEGAPYLWVTKTL